MGAEAKIKTTISYSRARIGHTGTIAVPTMRPVTADDLLRTVNMILDDIKSGFKDEKK